MILQSLRARVTFPPPADTTESNIRYLYAEIFFSAILGAITTFNSLFAVRLGATAALIGILSSAPALIQAILSIPSARYLEGKRNHKAWLLHSLLFMRVGHLAIVVLPIFAPQNTAVWLTVICLVLSVPSAFFINGFNAMLADLIPERRRAFVFSRRTVLWSAMVTIITFLAGIYLDSTTSIFPANYQVMYLFGVVTVSISQYFLWKLVVPELKKLSDTPKEKSPLAKMPLSKPMKNYLLNVFVYMTGLHLPGPLFVLHYANELRISDGLISFNIAVGTLSFVFGLFLWERLIRKRGFFWSMRLATCFTWIFPFTVALTGDFRLVIVANIVVNLIHPGMELSIVNVIFRLCTPEQRNMNMSYYTTVLSIAAFVAPLVAVPLSSAIGIPGVMLIGAGLRLMGGLLFNFNRVEETSPERTLQPAG